MSSNDSERISENIESDRVPQPPADLLAEIHQIPVRQPVALAEELPPHTELSQQWYFLTEAIKRDALESEAVRAALIPYCSRSVEQTLPEEVIQTIAGVDERVAKLAHRFNDKLGAFLALSEVPEDQISPDIRTAKALEDPLEDATFLQTYPEGSIDIKGEIQHSSDLGRYLTGITYPEKRVVSERYAFARDVKLLALGAELINEVPQLSEAGEADLPSGIHIQIDPSRTDIGPELLNPAVWNERKQTKDRVYTVGVNGQKYMLKERKTNRHTSTHKTGHEDGLTSREEYTLGKTMHDQGQRNVNGLVLSWENPLGYVEFPDGFSFCVFEYEEDLQKPFPRQHLQEAIISNRADFEDEYQRVTELAATFADHPYVLAGPMPQPPELRQADETSWLRRRLSRKTAVADVVPNDQFERFAQLRTRRMHHSARSVLQNTMRELGYKTTDQDDYAFRIPGPGIPEVEIVGFDYEYFTQIDPEQKAKFDKLAAESVLKHSETSLLPRYSEDTRLDRAMYMAILEVEGALPEEIKYTESWPLTQVGQ